MPKKGKLGTLSKYPVNMFLSLKRLTSRLRGQEPAVISRDVTQPQLLMVTTLAQCQSPSQLCQATNPASSVGDSTVVTFSVGGGGTGPEGAGLSANSVDTNPRENPLKR